MFRVPFSKKRRVICKKIKTFSKWGFFYISNSSKLKGRGFWVGRWPVITESLKWKLKSLQYPTFEKQQFKSLLSRIPNHPDSTFLWVTELSNKTSINPGRGGSATFHIPVRDWHSSHMRASLCTGLSELLLRYMSLRDGEERGWAGSEMKNKCEMAIQFSLSWHFWVAG